MRAECRRDDQGCWLRSHRKNEHAAGRQRGEEEGPAAIEQPPKGDDAQEREGNRGARRCERRAETAGREQENRAYADGPDIRTTS